MAFVGGCGMGAARQGRGAALCSARSGFVSAGAVVAPLAKTSTPARFTMKQEAWVQLCPTADLQPGEVKSVYVASQSILVACDDDGQVYASSNVCPHLGTPLDNGTVADGAIICAQHKSSWDLTTGEVKGKWCPFPPLIGPVSGLLQPARDLLVYSVRENNGYVEGLINIEARQDFEQGYWFGLLDSKGKATGDYY
eukprot:Plantae.Rhodophyta-Purpureofilum_apyrenoidigerum.ctg13328.p1 GENE.Plantae.Rhodophyta-Purpureofilum_apyrenoidigerum.ctg13328~~Plantae.Rhodophyta-Purpureofilum_apyrenoidigerum.ctg13328.p1  ORF type:complete len:196 (-),score=21.44 Plantae.Rhodophyta-Purpureofilum_apyrenoidigerum.ctg13328:178-765(-)